QRFGVECTGVEIGRIFFPQLAHRFRIGVVEVSAIRFGVGRVAFGQGIDPIALRSRRVAPESLRILNGLPGRLDGIFGHRKIDVWAERECHAPPAHRAMGIEPGSFAKRADCLRMVEAEAKLYSLVEQKLSARILGGYLMVVIAQALEDRCAWPVRL